MSTCPILCKLYACSRKFFCHFLGSKTAHTRRPRHAQRWPFCGRPLNVRKTAKALGIRPSDTFARDNGDSLQYGWCPTQQNSSRIFAARRRKKKPGRNSARIALPNTDFPVRRLKIHRISKKNSFISASQVLLLCNPKASRHHFLCHFLDATLGLSSETLRSVKFPYLRIPLLVYIWFRSHWTRILSLLDTDPAQKCTSKPGSLVHDTLLNLGNYA